MNQQLEITEQSNISIAELVQKQADGFSVLRSAHVGNVAPYNLVLANAGIPTLLVDQTITGVDKNYFPESILTQESQVTIAPTGVLVSRAAVNVGAVPDSLPAALKTDNLVELHIAGLEAAVPSTRAISDTAYVRKQEAIAGEITSLAARAMPALFSRVVLPDGRVERRADAAELLSSLGILALADEPSAPRSAVLMPLAVNIVTNFVAEALETDRAEQYHISGPDMVLYLRSGRRERKEVDALYELVKERASFKDGLPSRLTVQLVPGSYAVFATTAQRANTLNQLLAAAEAAGQADQMIAADKKAYFTNHQTNGVDRTQFEAGVRERKRSVDRSLSEAAASIPELFVAPRTPGKITQYDVLQEGGLYVPSQTTEMSMADLARLAQRIANARKRFVP